MSMYLEECAYPDVGGRAPHGRPEVGQLALTNGIFAALADELDHVLEVRLLPVGKGGGGAYF